MYQRESDAHVVIIEELFTTSEDGTEQDRGTTCWPSCKPGLKRRDSVFKFAGIVKNAKTRAVLLQESKSNHHLLLVMMILLVLHHKVVVLLALLLLEEERVEGLLLLLVVKQMHGEAEIGGACLL